jgi:hypothetical protein
MQASGGVCGSPLLFPHRRSGWPCRQDTDHADRTRRQPWPAAAAVPDPCPPRHTSCHVRDGCRDHPCPRWWPACRRRPDIRPGPQIADTGLAIDTTLAACAVHQPSAQWSFRKQRTVFRLVTTFSALPSSGDLRAAAARPSSAAEPQMASAPTSVNPHTVRSHRRQAYVARVLVLWPHFSSVLNRSVTSLTTRRRS